MLVVSVRSSDLFNMWVIDSDCSFNMRPRWDLFDTYDACNGDVIVGHNVPCRVTSIGSIRPWTCDG